MGVLQIRNSAVLKKHRNCVKRLGVARSIFDCSRRYPDNCFVSSPREQDAVGVHAKSNVSIGTAILPPASSKAPTNPAISSTDHVVTPAEAHIIKFEPLASELCGRHFKSIARSYVRPPI